MRLRDVLVPALYALVRRYVPSAGRRLLRRLVYFAHQVVSRVQAWGRNDQVAIYGPGGLVLDDRSFRGRCLQDRPGLVLLQLGQRVPPDFRAHLRHWDVVVYRDAQQAPMAVAIRRAALRSLVPATGGWRDFVETLAPRAALFVGLKVAVATADGALAPWLQGDLDVRWHRLLGVPQALPARRLPERIRLLFVLPRLSVSGPVSVIYNLIQHLDSDRFESWVAVTGEEPYPDYGDWRARFEQSQARGVFHVDRDSALVELVERHHIDIVHVSNAGLGYAALPRLKALPRPPHIVDHIHGEEGAFIELRRWYVELIDTCLVPSQTLQRTIQAHGTPGRVVQVPNFVDTDYFCPAARPSPGGPTVTFVGRLSEEKQPGLFLHAMEQLASRCPGLQVDMVGDGPLRARLEAQVQASPRLRGGVSFRGQQPSSLEALQRCDVLVLTSRTEGVPLVVLEAMACGKPFVSTAVGGIPEVFGPGRNGILIDRLQARPIAEAVASLLQDKSEAAARGEHNRRAAVARHSVAECVPRYVSVYETLVAEYDLQPDTLLLSVVIVSFNRLDDTLRLLACLHRNLRGPREIVLVDNGSDAEVVARLRRWADGHGDTHLVTLPSNTGCSGGRRVGLQATRGQYVVFLDNDIEVTPGCIDTMLAALAADPVLGGVCAKIVGPDDWIESNGGTVAFDGLWGRFDVYDPHCHRYDPATCVQRTCGWLPGGASMFRREALATVEFPDGYRNGFEDIDVSLQLGRAGYRLQACGDAVMIHHHHSFRSPGWRAEQATYLRARQDRKAMLASYSEFYRRNHTLYYNESVMETLGLQGLAAEQVLARLVEP